MFALQISGLGTLMTGINLITTIVKMRAPGMTLMKMPMFTWSALVANVIIVFAFPVLTVLLIWEQWTDYLEPTSLQRQMAVWICFGRTFSGFGDILKCIS